VTFQVNGLPSPSGSANTATVNTSTASQTVKNVTLRLDDKILPKGSGSYSVTALYTGATGSNYQSPVNASLNPLLYVAPESGSLFYNGSYLANDGNPINLAVVVSQPADSSPFDFNNANSPTYVRFDFYNVSNSYLSSYVAPISDASDWSTNANGLASCSPTLPSNYYDATFTVRISVVHTPPSGTACQQQTITATPIPQDPNTYLAAEPLQISVTMAPATGSFLTGGGFIAPANWANTTNTHGNYGFVVKWNKGFTNLQGNLVYVVRVNMNVAPQGSPANYRDVDIRVKSNSLSALSVTSGTNSASCPSNSSGVFTGKFSVQYLDSVTGQDYTQFDFGNGTFQLNVNDCGSGPSGDTFGLALTTSNGNTFTPSTQGFYVGSGTKINLDGSATQVVIGGGEITMHQ
jgi:hypothetical protein